MLVIRAPQIIALRRSAWSSFEDEMWARLEQHFSIDATLMGEAQARKVIHHGLTRADLHGLSTRGDLCRYIELSLSFGTFFDEDPQLPWVAGVLARGMEALRPRALAHLTQIAGANGKLYQRAMLRARRLVYEEAIEAAAAPPFAAAARAWLTALHPEKAATFDEETWGALLALGRAEAARRGLSDAGALVLLALMFMLGSHVARDPQVPWVAEVLEDPALAEPEAKGRALAARARAHLDRAMALLRAKGE